MKFIKIEEAKKKLCPFISNSAIHGHSTVLCSADECMKWESGEEGSCYGARDRRGTGRCVA